MASGISFPLKYSNFICEPYSSSYASCLYRLCGCKYLFLFAINDKKLVKYYIDRMDFHELPAAEEEIVVEYLKTYSNKNCKFLFQDIANM